MLRQSCRGSSTHRTVAGAATLRSGPIRLFPSLSLACRGPAATVALFVHEFSGILRRLQEPAAYPAVLATLVRVQGSSYRRVGARWLLDASGRRIGSISGGCLEDDLAERARRMQEENRAYDHVTYDTTAENDLVWGVGLGCHGVVQVALELLLRPPDWAGEALRHLERRDPVDLVVGITGAARGTRLDTLSGAEASPDLFRHRVGPPPALAVFGAGDDAQPLVRLGAALGWNVSVLDPRPGLATSDRFPEADAVRSLPAEDAAAAVTWDPCTAAVVMTHRYAFDRPLLRALLPLELSYLGLLGPRQRAERILAELAAEGLRISPRARAALHAPVGLDLGGDGASAVALSVVAEIQASLAGRDAQPLRDRAGPIHGS